MAALLARIQRANRPPFHSLTPREARIAYRMGAEILDLPRAPLARVQDLQVAGRPAHDCQRHVGASGYARDGIGGRIPFGAAKIGMDRHPPRPRMA
ncbi:MAG: hypothetical protein ACK44A_09850, partial [Roseateles sp.]